MKLPKINLNANSALNFVGAVIIFYLVAVLGQTVKHNYDLGRQIDDLRTQIIDLQGQKEQLVYSIAYYNTDAFRDREARARLGLQLPGENVVIIPHASPAPSASTQSSKTSVKHSNPQQWFDFLTGRI